ncbi:hypothetical protein JCM10296v2_006733 [Rhodotorula toruloides]
MSRASSSSEDFKNDGSVAIDSKSPSELEATFAWDSEDRFASIDRKKLLRRIDKRILIYICITYMFVRLDLNNISNAGTMNSEVKHSLKQVLHLSAGQWAWVLSAFYYPYAVAEPICTFFVKATSPSIWLGRIFVSWGIVMACMAAVTNYGGLVACRALLGLLEGSYFTSVIYHWSFWYTPAEMAPRVLWLYVANSSSGGFSGLFAYAISFSDSAKIYGWQVLFILEGLITVALGIGMFVILPDWPSTSKWLSPLEQEYVVHHLHKDAPKQTAKTWDAKQIKRMFADPTFYFFSLFWACYAVSAWGIGTVLPFVIKDLGITDSAGTQLLQIPPSATGVAMCIISAYLIRNRGISAFAVTLVIIAGVLVSFAVFLTAKPAGLRYAAVCVISGSTTTAYACLWPRRVAALRGTSAAALGIGINNAISQLSGIVGPQVWRLNFGPRYETSAKISLAFCSADFVIVIILWWLMEYPHLPGWLKKRVLAQTQITAEDQEAAKRGETIGTGEEKR